MADAQVLREFLVALGFKVDQKSLTTITTTVKHVTQDVMKLGTVALGAAFEVAAAVDKIADHLEDLYYSAQRIGTSVANLQKFQYGASQIGITADRAKGALEGFGMALRSSPGLVGWLNQMGIQTAGRKTDEIFKDLISRLAKVPFPIAQAIASRFGIDPNLLFQLIQGLDKLNPLAEQYNKILKNNGLNADEAAKRSVEFKNEVRGLEGRIEALYEAIAFKLEPYLIRMIKFIDEQVDAFSRWNRDLGGIPGVILAVTTAIGGVLAVLSLLGVVLSPITIAVAAIGVAAAAVVTDFLEWQKTGEGFLAWADIVKELGGVADIFRGIGDAVSSAFEAMAAEIGISTSDIRDFINGTLLFLLNTLKDIAFVIGDVFVAGLRTVAGLFPGLVSAVGDFGGSLNELWQTLKGLVNSDEFSEFSSVLLAVAETIIKLGVGAAIRVLADTFHILADSIRIIVDLLRGDWESAWAGAKKVVDDLVNAAIHQIENLINGISWLKRRLGIGGPEPKEAPLSPRGPAPSEAPAVPPAVNDNNMRLPKLPQPGGAPSETPAPVDTNLPKLPQPSLTPPQPGGAPSAPPASVDTNNMRLPKGVRFNNPGNLMTGPGGTEGHYRTPEEGFQAMAAQLLKYVRTGADTIDSIIHKYAGAQYPGNTPQSEETYKRKLEGALGVGRFQHLNLNEETLTKLMESMTGVEQGGLTYGHKLIQDAAHARLAPNAGAAPQPVTMAQTNNITITGAGDPKATGQQTTQAMNRVNGDLVRNLVGAIR